MSLEKRITENDTLRKVDSRLGYNNDIGQRNNQFRREKLLSRQFACLYKIVRNDVGQREEGQMGGINAGGKMVRCRCTFDWSGRE